MKQTNMDSNNANTTAILFSDEVKGYDFGIGHPFRGDRYPRFRKVLSEKLPAGSLYRSFGSEPVADEDLLLICEKDYIEFTRQFFGTGSLAHGIMERFSHFHSMDNLVTGRPSLVERAARYIVGQAKTACNLVMNGDYSTAISIGGGLHHAKRAYGEGFCLYNDVAFCGIYLTETCNLERVLILDTDAHSGNGTMDYFYSNPNVLFINVHQDPRTIYPGTGFIEQTGEGAGKGFTVNVPMPVKSGNDAYELVFNSIIMPMTEEFRPEIIIRNGGSDPHYYDELTNLGLSLAGFRMIGEKVREMSSVCDGRVIDLIASGYNLDILPYAWLSLIGGLTGADIRLDEEDLSFPPHTAINTIPQTEDTIQKVKDALKEYWKCFRQEF